jgi:hypothetical protein
MVHRDLQTPRGPLAVHGKRDSSRETRPSDCCADCRVPLNCRARLAVVRNSMVSRRIQLVGSAFKHPFMQTQRSFRRFNRFLSAP